MPPSLPGPGSALELDVHPGIPHLTQGCSLSGSSYSPHCITGAHYLGQGLRVGDQGRPGEWLCWDATCGAWWRLRPSPVTPGGLGTWILLSPHPGAAQVSTHRLRWCLLASAQPGHHCLASPPTSHLPAQPCQRHHHRSSLLPLQAKLLGSGFLSKPSLRRWHPSLLPRGFSGAGGTQCRQERAPSCHLLSPQRFQFYKTTPEPQNLLVNRLPR